MPESTTPKSIAPMEIAAILRGRVVGQERAIREAAIVLSKVLGGLSAGNVLLIGSSGSGKTTLMRAIEEFLVEAVTADQRPVVVRLHANVLAEDAIGGRPGQTVLWRLLEAARELRGPDVAVGDLLRQIERGIVFVDEVDKIRGRVEGVPQVEGIRAQEALLTLIENERTSLELPTWAGGGRAVVDTAKVLFVCAGAFEGLYDAVYDRVTVGEDRGALREVTVVDGDDLRQEAQFELSDWLRQQDLFDYGMTPQFLSRFESIVLFGALSVDDLVRIFLTRPEIGLDAARDYFGQHGIELAVSPAAVRRIAEAAAAQPRVGARALREVFRRVMRGYEYEPARWANEGRTLVIDETEIAKALKPT